MECVQWPAGGGEEHKGLTVKEKIDTANMPTLARIAEKLLKFRTEQTTPWKGSGCPGLVGSCPSQPCVY